MFLKNILESLSTSHPAWRIVRANLTSGLSESLHSQKDLIRFAKDAKINTFLADFDPSDPATVPDFIDIVQLTRDRRYAQPSGPRPSVDPDPKRVFAVPEHFPCAHMNSISLSGQDLYRVVPYSGMKYVIHDSFWRRPEVVDLDISPLPDSASPYEIREWCELLAELPEEEREFQVKRNGRLSSGIVWFTPYLEIPDVLTACAPEDRAERIRDYLGLVHYCTMSDPAPTHLFGLTFPGEAADKAGHYRPCALDSLDNSRFMVPFSSSPDWGATADLAVVNARIAPPTGAPERVANQIWDEDFDGAPVRFEYLGAVETPHRFPDLDYAELLESIF